MEIEEMGLPVVSKTHFFLKKRPRVSNESYIFFLLDLLEEDLQDAFADPIIWEECVMSARDKLNSCRKWLKGEI
jgi:hypothetical protein